MPSSKKSQLLRIGVLGSGKGSNFKAILDAMADGKLDVEVTLVGTDIAGAGILDHAASAHLPAYTCEKGAYKTKLEPEIEQALAEALLKADVELLVLAGYMRVLKAPLLAAFPNRIINIHPSLLPKFPGLEAWRQALEAGEREAGCTVHWVNEVIDGGAIIRQRSVSVLEGDTAESLQQRIQVEEHLLLPEVIAGLANGDIPWPSKSS